jgi:hypothetical protein
VDLLQIGDGTLESICFDDAKVCWEYTPWDKKYLALNAVEIKRIENASRESLVKCLTQLSGTSGAQLIYGRFCASDLLIKGVLLSLGYYPVETSASVSF